jgi:putative spermidine/putrescine transport system permease protein
VVIAMFVSGGDNSTLARNMFNAFRDQVDPTIAAISTGMIVISSPLLALFQLFGRSGDRS